MQRPHQSRSTVWYIERGTFKRSTDRLTERPWVSNAWAWTHASVSVCQGKKETQTRPHELSLKPSTSELQRSEGAKHVFPWSMPLTHNTSMGLTWPLRCQTDSRGHWGGELGTEAGHRSSFSKRDMTHGQQPPSSNWTNLETHFSFPFFLCKGEHTGSVYRERGLSTCQAEKAFGGGFLNFLFLSLNFFFPLAVGQLGPNTQEKKRSVFKSFFAGTQPWTQNCQVPEGVPFPLGPRKSRGRLPGKGQVVATTMTLGSGLLLSHSAT